MGSRSASPKAGGDDLRLGSGEGGACRAAARSADQQDAGPAVRRGGLYSTAADYFRFAQMMLNGGELDGNRLLKTSSVDMMRSNVLNDQTLNSNSGIGPVHLQPGFGYDFAVMSDPVALKSPLGKG
jgi:CubicO group peptidase (beta-lactamase class C family)